MYYFPFFFSFGNTYLNIQLLQKLHLLRYSSSSPRFTQTFSENAWLQRLFQTFVQMFRNLLQGFSSILAAGGLMIHVCSHRVSGSHLGVLEKGSNAADVKMVSTWGGHKNVKKLSFYLLLWFTYKDNKNRDSKYNFHEIETLKENIFEKNFWLNISCLMFSPE